MALGLIVDGCLHTTKSNTTQRISELHRLNPTVLALVKFCVLVLPEVVPTVAA